MINSVISSLVLSLFQYYKNILESGIENLEFFGNTVHSCLMNIKMSRESLRTLREDLAAKSIKIIKEFKEKNKKQVCYQQSNIK